jgi:hypothetical protein
MVLMAVSASVIQVFGLIPPYFELAKRGGRVIGINFWFLIIDYAGAFFSLMAVGKCLHAKDTLQHLELTQEIVAQQWFDALGASLYIAWSVLSPLRLLPSPNPHQLTSHSMVLETGIFASQAIWLWRVRHIRRAAKKAGMSYDEYVEKHLDVVKLPRCESSETFRDVETGHREDGTYNCAEQAKTTEETSAAMTTTASKTAGTMKEEVPRLPPPAVTKTSLSG